MSSSPSPDAVHFVQYLQSTVKLDALEKMSTTLDQELADSQQALTDIRALFDCLNKQSQPVDNSLRHEDISKFLEAEVPNLLLPDMTEQSLRVDLDDVIKTMKGYAEDLNKKIALSPATPHSSCKDLSGLDLDQYSLSLDQLAKKLANIKLLTKRDLDIRNFELEEKLTQLCEHVTRFTQMVEAQSGLSEHNQNWSEMKLSNSALCYDSIISKMLAGINEVAYLLQNKN